MTVALLADYPEHVETLAHWHAEHDGHGDDRDWLALWREALRRESGREKIPLAFIALDGEAPVGGVSLVEHNMSTHRELSPWLAGTFVHPSRRGEGVARCSFNTRSRARSTSACRGCTWHTESASGFYEQLGWRRLFDERYEGDRVTVMTLEDLARRPQTCGGFSTDAYGRSRAASVERVDV